MRTISSSSTTRIRFVILWLLSRFPGRQDHGNLRSFSNVALNVYSPSVGLDNAETQGKAEPCTLPHRFGAEKRFKNLAQILWRDSDPRVSYRDDNGRSPSIFRKTRSD